MKKKIVFRIIGLLLILLPFSCTFYLLEYKFYYTVEDVTFTFWNTFNGCYIMPYKYTGLLFPKDNYMIVSPLDCIDIFVGDDIIYVFSQDSYKKSYLPFSSDEGKYKVFADSNTDNDRLAAWEYCKKMKYPKIQIYIFGMRIKNDKPAKFDFNFCINFLQLPLHFFIISMRKPKAFFDWLLYHIFFLEEPY